MFSRSERSGNGRIAKPGAPGLSFIGAEVVVSGDITSTAQLHVDGRVDGNVSCAQLCLGESGVVSGNIDSDDARISGLVEGMVTGRTLVLEAKARIKGDISYQVISIAAGAQVDGRLARQSALADNGVIVATPIAQPQRAQDEAEEPVQAAQELFRLSAPRKAAG